MYKDRFSSIHFQPDLIKFRLCNADKCKRRVALVSFREMRDRFTHTLTYLYLYVHTAKGDWDLTFNSNFQNNDITHLYLYFLFLSNCRYHLNVCWQRLQDQGLPEPTSDNALECRHVTQHLYCTPNKNVKLNRSFVDFCYCHILWRV